MTENQLFPMSADLFETSSNSSNPLKFDLYASLGLSNSNSSSLGLFSSAASFIPTLSPPPQLTIVTASTTTTASSPASSGVSSISTSSTGSGGSGSGPSNVLLTNAITIPRSNNSNQNNYHHYLSSSYPDETPALLLHHHRNPSPLQNPIMMAQHQQQQHQRQGQLQQQQQQQQQHHHQPPQSPPMLADLSEYGLDALDASSLSPTLLQDVSLSAASTMHNSNSVTPTITPSGIGNNSSGGFYTQDIASPISQSSASGSVAGIITSDNHTLLSLNANITDDVNNPLIYEVSNTLWSDIGSAIITTKNEPFSIEEDYIFPIDKTGSSFSDMPDGTFLDDFSNIEEFLPVTTASNTAVSGSGSGFMLSPQSSSSLHQLNSPQASPGGPPLELLQHQQQFTLLHSLQSSSQQQQQQQFSSSSASSSGSGGGGGGAIHHAHHNHHSSSSPYDIYHSTPNKQQQQQHQLNNNSSTSNTFSPGSQPSHSPLQQLNSSITPPPPRGPQYTTPLVKSRNRQELIKKGFSMSPDRSSNALGQSVPGSQLLISGNALSPSSASSGFGSTTGGSNVGSVRKSFGYQGADSSSSRLSSSAPTHLGLEHIWMRREPRQHLLSTGSLAEAESYSSLSTGSVLSPEGNDLSQEDDDDASTDYNSDHYDDYSTDGSDNDDDGRMTSHQLSSSKGKERFFWQYNVQAKGPKGKRLVFQSKLEDPHVLNEVTDPVFSPNCSVRGIKVYKHSGKARKGDGNDLTPNARKLHNIGKELDKLSRTINDMTPVSELPFNVRPKSRKEKNKLASRACRLKKKAQHEANKIKLYGLEIEHKRLINGIAELKHVLALKYINSSEPKEEFDQKVESIYQTASSIRIAGGTTDFVNKVLENMKGGMANGGLEDLRNS